jgi:hypothetical protein
MVRERLLLILPLSPYRSITGVVLGSFMAVYVFCLRDPIRKCDRGRQYDSIDGLVNFVLLEDVRQCIVHVVVFSQWLVVWERRTCSRVAIHGLRRPDRGARGPAL